MKFLPNIWFSPQKVLKSYLTKEKAYGDKFERLKGFKIMYEARIASTFLLGLIKNYNEEHFLQIVDPQEGFPDIRTGYFVDKPNEKKFLAMQNVEIVTLTSNSKDNIFDFLVKTKLNSKKKYPDGTTILCYVNSNTLMESNDTYLKLQFLLGKNLKYYVYILGRVKGAEPLHALAQVHPNYWEVEFNLMEELEKPNSRNTLRLFRSTKKLRFVESGKYEPF